MPPPGSFLSPPDHPSQQGDATPDVEPSQLFINDDVAADNFLISLWYNQGLLGIINPVVRNKDISRKRAHYKYHTPLKVSLPKDAELFLLWQMALVKFILVGFLAL